MGLRDLTREPRPLSLPALDGLFVIASGARIASHHDPYFIPDTQQREASKGW